MKTQTSPKNELLRKNFGKLFAFPVIVLALAALVLPLTSIQALVVYDTEDLPDLEINEEIQFYENAKFASKDLTYSYSNNCSNRKRDMDKAFQILEEKTDLTFTEVEEGDIKVSCSESGEGNQVAEGGPSRIIRQDNKTKIVEGQIYLYGEEKDCENPVVEIHELLHVLGFNHEGNKDSTLYPYYHCDQEIPSAIIQHINLLY